MGNTSTIGGAHLAIGNQQTYPAMATRGCLATYGNISQWRKVLDLFSDVLSTRPGQYVFFNVANILHSLQHCNHGQIIFIISHTYVSSLVIC